MLAHKQSVIDRVVDQARDTGVRLVRFLYTDNGGVIRGKLTNVTTLRQRITDGIGLTVAMMAMNILDQLSHVEEMGPVGEIRLTPDPQTFKVLPYADKAAAMTVDMLKLDGAPWEACPRSFLKRQVEAARELDITLQMAVELEWTMAQKLPDGSFQPVDESLCFSSTGMTITHQAILDTVEALEAQQIPVELYYPELGHGQQEMSVHHADPLTAADTHIFTRETIRNVAYNHGLYASLAPKPFLNQAGNGGHIHFSLWDKNGQRNLMYDPGGAYAVGEIGRQFIAGILDHLPGLLAITCPTHNSYRRLQPHFWSSAFTAWGPDNREGAIRLVSRFRSDEEGSSNAELKAADLSANPYLAFGALIAAGLDGVKRKLDPGEPTLVDPGNLAAEEMNRRGIRRFPTTLKESLDALEKDKTLTDALGYLLAKSFMAVKRLEYKTFSENDEVFETKHHFWKF